MALMLEGLKVLDFSNNIAGPSCAAILGDHGAEVIKIEKPVFGDDCRFFVPVIDGSGAMHFWGNRNKKSVTLDLKDTRALEIVHRLLKDSDVVIESFRPGVMDALGLGYEACAEINSKIVYCSISGFGQSGPYKDRPGYDVIAQAFSGMMMRTGDPNGSPTKIGAAPGDTMTAINAFGCVMLALYYRSISGKGQHIDVSLARTMMWNQTRMDSFLTGEYFKRAGNHDSTLCPYGIFNGNNGESIVIGAANTATWKKLCMAMNRSELAEDEHYVTVNRRIERKDEVINLVEDWLKTFTNMNQAEKQLLEAGVPCCRVYGESDLINDQHVRSCSWLKEMPTPDSIYSAKTYLGCYGLADFSEGQIKNEAAPDLGQHNVEVIGTLGIDEKEIIKMETEWSQERRG